MSPKEEESPRKFSKVTFCGSSVVVILLVSHHKRLLSRLMLSKDLVAVGDASRYSPPKKHVCKNSSPGQKCEDRAQTIHQDEAPDVDIYS